MPDRFARRNSVVHMCTLVAAHAMNAMKTYPIVKRIVFFPSCSAQNLTQYVGTVLKKAYVAVVPTTASGATTPVDLK